jgi:hypothetical protein
MPLKPPPKIYSLQLSPLFGIKGLEQFEKVVGRSFQTIQKLLLKNNNYSVWTNDKGREIQEPIFSMKIIHDRIGTLLSRIELPEYIHSKKKRSYITNAKQHIGSHPIAKTDIYHFYPSTTHQMIFNMFKDTFNCSNDIAHCLASICCFNKHLPTGSSLSGRIAFFSAKGMFEEIATLANSSGCNLTIYVDDITISGNNVTKKLLSEVRAIIRRHGLSTRNKKSKTFASHSNKEITGVIVTKDSVKVPNKRHLKRWELEKSLMHSDDETKPKIERELRGRRLEAKQILDQNNN